MAINASREVGKEGKEQIKLNSAVGVRVNWHELTTNKPRLNEN